VSRSTTEVLREAVCRFPEGCLCEDYGVCGYCRFILSCLEERNNCASSLTDESDDGALPNNMQAKIPAG